ncbi:hypothetical protein [Pseudomonas wadenswilerensis]
MTHRATYRYLALLAVTLGLAQGGPLIEMAWECGLFLRC